MTGEDFLKAHAAYIAWRDGHYNGFNGMMAVLFVMRNRSQDPRWGNWKKAIQSNAPGRSYYYLMPDTREPAFQRVLQYLDEVFDGTLADNLTGGGVAYETDEESSLALRCKSERTAQVGTLTFFKSIEE